MNAGARDNVVIRDAKTGKLLASAKNAIVTAGLNWMAKKLAGESDAIDFRQAWRIQFDTTMLTATITTSDNVITIKARHTPTQALNLAGANLTLRVGDSNAVILALAAANTFSPALGMVASGQEIVIDWTITAGWTGRVDSTLGNNRAQISSGSPYLATDAAAIANRMMDCWFGTEDMSGLRLIWYELSRETDPADARDLETGGTITMPSEVSRSGAVISFEWEIPSATETLALFRERVMVPHWDIDPMSSFDAIFQRGAMDSVTRFTCDVTMTSG